MPFPAAPTIIPQNSVTLTQGIHSVTLPAPQFDNTDEVTLTRINRETREKELKIFSDPIWPTIERFTWRFIGLSQTQRDNLDAFIAATLGLEVTVVDHETRTWTVLVIKLESPVTQIGPGCQYTAELNLEVV